MHESLQGIFPQEAVVIGRNDFRLCQTTQRQVTCTLQSQRFVKLALQVCFHWHSRKLFNQHSQQDKSNITIYITFLPQRRFHNFLFYHLAERSVQPQIITDLNGIIPGFRWRYIFFLKLEIRICPRICSYIHRMLCISTRTEQTAFIAILINHFLIER